MRVLRAADHRRMPWRNGGGETREIAAFPPGADTATFDWRISVATVAADGPFSVFPGADRVLAVLGGEGMELEIEGLGTHVLTPRSAPLLFPADAPTLARLAAGPITDLNVMVRRGRFTAEVERGEGDAVFAPFEGTSLLLALGRLAAEAGPDRVRLERNDAILLEEPLALRTAGEAGFTRVRLAPLPPAGRSTLPAVDR